MSNEKGTHLGEGSRPVSVSFLQVLYNVGIIPAREQYRDINKGVVRSGSSPRVPCGARLLAAPTNCVGFMFQSTRPARGATVRPVVPRDGAAVSIHAPRTGRDARPTSTSGPPPCVSIHAPRTGRDLARGEAPGRQLAFQSTRPARGATMVFFISILLCWLWVA